MLQFECIDYVFNVNDSYWFVNSSSFFIGYLLLYGGEGIVCMVCICMNDFILVNLIEQGVFGLDVWFMMSELKEVIFSNRSLMVMELKDCFVVCCKG